MFDEALDVWVSGWWMGQRRDPTRLVGVELPEGPVEAGLFARLRDRFVARSRPWVNPSWFTSPVRWEVYALFGMAPGPQMVGALSALASGPCPADHSGEARAGDPVPGSAGMPCECQVVIATAWDAVTSWSSARSAVAVVDAAGSDVVMLPRRGRVSAVVDPAREVLSVSARVSPVSMGNRIHAARNLMSHVGLFDLVTSGGCSAWTARQLIAEVETLPAAVANSVLDHVVDRIRRRHRLGLTPWTCGEARMCARRRRLRVDDGVRDSARRRARAGRGVWVRPIPDGMAVLSAVLREVDADRVFNRVTAIAQGLDDTSRTLDQQRADVFVDLLLDTPHPVDRSGAGVGGTRQGEVAVVVSVATLLGGSDEPGHVPGVGPVDAATARELAADRRWRAWVTDVSGAVTATSSTTYTPTAGLARLVRAREPYCRMPGCRRLAAGCDLDHTIPWPRGETSEANLGPLCRRHHNMKTHGYWRLDPGPEPGTWTWTTPTGATIYGEAESVLAERTPPASP